MPNYIKYSTTIPSGSLKKGNAALGITDEVTGPTSTTGWYSGINPQSGSYVVYEVAASGDPDIYCPQNATELLNLVKSKGATGGNTGSVAAALAWISTQNNLLATNKVYPDIVTSGSVFYVDAGFVGSYPVTGSTWYDLSGYANNGTLINGPSFNPNGYIVFDGVDDYVSVPNTSSLQITEQITLGSWFKLSSSATGQPTIILKETYISATNNSGYLLRNTRSNNSIYIALFNDFISTAGTPTNSINLDTWYYACGTYDGSQIKMYLNGTLQATTNYSGGIKANTSTLYIGQPSAGYRMNGNVAVTQIYNRALSQTEILQNYYQAPIVTDGLVFAVDAGNLVSYESGSTSAYSLTGSDTGYLWYGTEFTNNNGGTFKFGTNRNTSLQAVSASAYSTSPINLPGYGSYTISTWVKRTAFGTWKSGNTNYDGIWNYYWDHNLAFTGENTGINGIYGTGLNAYAINMNQWYNIVMTHKDYNVQSTNNHKTYLNGVLISTATITNPTLDGGLPKRFYIGNWDTSWSMVGELANLQVYSKELSSDEVNQNFNAYRGKFGI